ncbi:MAG: hypothetical protein H7836_17660, partial [Magnetococcus sp. YQC-3]
MGAERVLFPSLEARWKGGWIADLWSISMKRFAYVLGIVLFFVVVSGTGRAQDDVAVIKKAA